MIRILPEEVAARIAAGEVIERPASVVKELVENSIDAGATDITIEIGAGGRRLIRVIDNGEGIPSDDVPLAFQRYATSKLQAIGDLAHISTLGFRGEALPSIAAVAQVTMATRANGEEVGTLMRLEGGRVIRREGRGAARGTVVTVENLFYNTPARRKFLRSQSTEGRRVSELVTYYAMAYPGLRFSLLTDGRTAFQSKGSGELYDVLVDAYGLEIAQQMLEIEVDSPTKSAIHVRGFVSDPILHRSNSRHMTVLVNGRWVRDRLVSYAIREAYVGLLPKGRHPIVVVKVKLPPDWVDINVHPAKSEIRFRDSGEVFAVVQRAVRQTIVRKARLPPTALGFGWEGAVDTAGGPPVGAYRSPTPFHGELALEVQRTEKPMSSAQLPDSGKLPMLRVLGQLGRAYIVAESPTGMYLIDQHAAHERVLYERLQRQRAKAGVSSQGILEPLVLETGPLQAERIEERLANLRQFGFEIEPFGGDTYLVRAVPAVLQGSRLNQVILDIIDDAWSDDRAPSWEEGFVTSLACHGAMKSGQTLSLEEMQELVRQLEETSLPRTCPHGRPTMLHVSAERLEREFGRR